MRQENDIISAIKVSIIIPVYNTAPFLIRCINSVLNQTLKEIEIICINDGSTDNSLEILNNFKNIDNRIIIINQQNYGVSRARNTGIEKAKGEYIAFLDSDDFITHDFYEKLYTLAKEQHLDIAKGNVKLFDSEGKEKEFDENYKILSSGKPPSLHSFNSKWFSAIYKKQLIDIYNIRFPESITYKEDTVFLFHCKLVAKNFDIISDCYYYYCYQRPQSLSNSVSYESIKHAFTNIYYRIQILNNNDIDNETYLHLLSNCIKTLYSYIYQYNVYTFPKYKTYEILHIIKRIYSICDFSKAQDLTKKDFIVALTRPVKHIHKFIRDHYTKQIYNITYWNEIKKLANTKPITIEYKKISYKHTNRLIITHSGISFEAFLLPKPLKKLYVFLSATGHWDTEYPYFERIRWAKDMDGICLFIDDPTRVEKQINLSFFWGNKEKDYKDFIVDICKQVAYIYNIPNNNIYIIGHANAGFASIYICDKIIKSNCIALNPQISIFNYFNDNNKDDALEFEKKMDISRDDIIIQSRVDLSHIINQKNSKFFIFSNIKSKTDFNQITYLFNKANTELKTELNIIGNIICFTPQIDSPRPHHVFPDQFICKIFSKLLKKQITKYDIELLTCIKEQLVKIEYQKIEKQKLENIIKTLTTEKK